MSSSCFRHRGSKPLDVATTVGLQHQCKAFLWRGLISSSLNGYTEQSTVFFSLRINEEKARRRFYTGTRASLEVPKRWRLLSSHGDLEVYSLNLSQGNIPRKFFRTWNSGRPHIESFRAARHQLRSSIRPPFLQMSCKRNAQAGPTLKWATFAGPL